MSYKQITQLEKQWAYLKYEVLEKDPATYQKIRTLLKYKSDPDVTLFYELVAHARQQPIHQGHQQTALEHVWGYFKKICTLEEKTKFENELRLWLHHEIEHQIIKRTLFDLALKYHVIYLIESSYFDSVRT